MDNILTYKNEKLWFYLITGITTVFALLGFLLEDPMFLLVPGVVILGSIALTDIRYIFYLLLFTLPISFEFIFLNGFALALPTEPLMAALLLLYFFYVAVFLKQYDFAFIKHPITQLALVHLFWIGLAALYASLPFVAFKFFLAKCWYIIPFVLVSGIFIKDQKDFKPVFWIIFIPLLLVVLQTLIRHAAIDFSFALVNRTMTPFFRNHVDYAVMIVVFLPFVIAARFWYKSGSFARLLCDFGILIFILGIVYSYTRAAMGSLVIIPAAYIIFRFNLARFAIAGGLVVAFVAIIFLSRENAYLAFAPNYEKTIYHENWKRHLRATLNFRDVSSMERVYRWIAAFRMSTDHPVIGFGPNNFYHHYKEYTVSNFETYVSDNPEQSTVHNYYLLTIVEQGYVGLIILLSLIIAALITCQRLVHSSLPPPDKQLAMAAGVAFLILLANIFLADLIELDKTGSIFFMCFAIFVNLDLKRKRLSETSAS